ncbi:Tetratricopeptide repeat-containing domain [Macleaya cordata]|uniref:Tetratricopeptide repeat-containing domain n=1 Tax=Macleaya cordata TaxID=56857 RepID=A0A200RDJ8_MACCD|nr:Tetratricopeptide repeat-containing domain [Macleaya cordata]
MAVLLGNLTLLVDAISPRTGLPDRKTRQVVLDMILNLPKSKRDSQLINNVSLFTKNFESDKEIRNFIFGVRKRVNNSKANSVDFDSESSDDENGNGFGEDWEQQMRKRLKEMEEMRELEKKAEELQSQMEEEDDEGDFKGEDDEETEEQKRMRVRKELEKVAKEQAERRETAQLMYELGQKAYGKGMYGRAIEYLEGALTIIPRPTLFGGEIQIWLAMAYEANNRHSDCIALYQELEKKHPMIGIRRQAAELRYILQAPKLKISRDEMVTIPLIGSSYDSYAGTWSDKYKDQPQSLSGGTTNQLPSTKDYLGDFMVWRPPIGWENNRGLYAALALWVGLVGVALILQR